MKCGALRRRVWRSACDARQIPDANDAALARKGQRAGAAALLLAETADVVTGGVVDLDAAAVVDSEPVDAREISVAKIILRAGRGRVSKGLRPPGT